MEIKQTIDKEHNEKMSSFRWVICGLLFLATTVNYMDRQVLSLTWKDFISPEFHWTDADYGVITAIFSIVYAVANLFAGRFIDWMGTKKGYLWAIGVWSAGACLHALCGWATEHTVGLHDAAEMVSATGTVALACGHHVGVLFHRRPRGARSRRVGQLPRRREGDSRVFPQARPRLCHRHIQRRRNCGRSCRTGVNPAAGPFFQNMGVGNGWEMAFIVIGGLGFVWMGLWMFYYVEAGQ